jgi:hypothetical protein
LQNRNPVVGLGCEDVTKTNRREPAESAEIQRAENDGGPRGFREERDETGSGGDFVRWRLWSGCNGWEGQELRETSFFAKRTQFFSNACAAMICNQFDNPSSIIQVIPKHGSDGP